jgi:hypothetical protein
MQDRKPELKEMLNSRRNKINHLKLKFKLNVPVELQNLLPDNIVNFLKNQAHFLDCVQQLTKGNPLPSDDSPEPDNSQRPYVLYS